MRRAQQRPRNRSTRKRRHAQHRKRHSKACPRLRDIGRIRSNGGREERLESCAEHAVEDGEGVVGWDAGDAQPGIEHDDVAEEADDEDVEDADVAVCDEAGEDARGEADAVEEDDEIERCGVGHA